MAHPELQDGQSDTHVIVGVGVVVFCFVCHKQMADECHGAFHRVDT
jgi:hypothetical protein